MKTRKLIVVFLFVITLVSCSDNTEKEYYSGGKVKSEITIVDGKKNGPAKAYYESGELKREGTYVNDSLEGNVITYFINGQKETETNYIGGKKTGLYKEYYENGELKTEANLKNGKQDGLTKEYYETGKLQVERNFKNGARDGEFTFYYPNGKLKNYAITENDITIYYQEYDSLGNKGKEHREVRAEIKSQTIKLGETFTAKLSLTGPVNDLIMNVSAGEAANINDIKFFSDLPINESKQAIYSFTPKKRGAYAWKIMFIVEDKDHTNRRLYLYENVFVCD